MKRKKVLWLLPLLCVLLPIAINGSEPGKEAFNVNRFPFGPENSKWELVTIPINSIFSSALGKTISCSDFVGEISKSRIVLVGESHTADIHHKMQLKIVQSLFELGKPVILALEMFPPSANECLNGFVSGAFSEEDFLTQSHWFKIWGHNFRYYKPIFDYARQKKIPLFGINIPHSLASKVRMIGIEGLSPEERNGLPLLDKTSKEHRFLVNAMLDGIGALAPETFDHLYDAQCLWDSAMGEGAIKLSREYPMATVVVLAGSGHVAYNLGIPKIIQNRSDFSFSSVLAVDIEQMEKKSDKNKSTKTKSDSYQFHLGKDDGIPQIPSEIVSRGLANFLIGVPQEDKEKFPTFGIGLKGDPKVGIFLSMIFPGSMGEKMGLQKGDKILEINGKIFETVEEMKKFLSLMNWGDGVSFLVLRQGKRKKIRFVL
ncbi:ChaN family lipoprotein [bacterium]|nr:ChaN family lipoprotein [bacterium]